MCASMPLKVIRPGMHRKSSGASRILIELATAQQPLRDVGSLKGRALGWRMGCKVARYRDQDVPARSGVTPFTILPHARFQHLVGMETRILTEQTPRESRHEYFRWVAKRKMARNQSAGRVNPPLAIECLQQRRLDFLDLVGKIVQGITIFAGQPRWRHVEVAGEVDCHRSVKHPARRFEPALLTVGRANPLQCLMNSIGISE